MPRRGGFPGDKITHGRATMINFYIRDDDDEWDAETAADARDACDPRRAAIYFAGTDYDNHC